MEEMTDEVGGGKQATLSVWMVLQPTYRRISCVRSFGVQNHRLEDR